MLIQEIEVKYGVESIYEHIVELVIKDDVEQAKEILQEIKESANYSYGEFSDTINQYASDTSEKVLDLLLVV